MWKVLLVSVTMAAAATHSLASPFGGFLADLAQHLLDSDTNPGEPLFLTPYINSGQLEEARQLSRVKGLDTYVESYSGFLTVNTTHNSNMFFWFFPAKHAAKSAPVVLWLQGGPGYSSLRGLFVENGPFSVNSEILLVPRNYSWHNNHSMLYIDNPVGTGFSFTSGGDMNLINNSDGSVYRLTAGGYATNEDDVARDLYSALIQFFTLFDSYKKNDFYVTGQSYAGKFVPAISYKIHVENSRAGGLQIPLKGLAIGNGFCDPINQLNYSDFLYNIGLISAAVRDQMAALQNQTKANIEQGNYASATFNFYGIIDMYRGVTRLNNIYNFLLQDHPEDTVYYYIFVQLNTIRRALHVGSLEYSNHKRVTFHMTEAFMRSANDKIVALLDSDYNVMFYNGLVDVIVDHTGTENFLSRLPWKGQEEFNRSERHVWEVDSEVAGYFRQSGGLLYVLVRNAGHDVPYDQPKWAYDMINRFIGGTWS